MKLDAPVFATVPARRVLEAIRLAGGEARFVGGCVRDAIMRRKFTDYDLATTLKPEAVMAACEAAGCKVIPTGIKHGTVTVVADHQVFEVTTLRRDVTTDGRWAEVEYTDDWQQDAARRDFTMNALFCDMHGNVTDFFTGLEDIKNGIVRFVGVPELRLKEDVLRILRFFRFHAHYGHGAPDTAGLEACKALVSLLPTLSTERVRVELLKLLNAPDPLPTWRLMAEIGVFNALNLPLTNIARLEQVVAHEKTLGLSEPLRRLWASIEGEFADIGTRLRLSNTDAQRITALMHLPVVPADEKAQLRLAYKLSAQTVMDALIVSGGATRQNLEQLERWQRPQLPLNGADLVKLGMSQSPAMGEVLEKVEAWWIEQNFTPDHAACVAQAKRLLA